MYKREQHKPWDVTTAAADAAGIHRSVANAQTVSRYEEAVCPRAQLSSVRTGPNSVGVLLFFEMNCKLTPCTNNRFQKEAQTRRGG